MKALFLAILLVLGGSWGELTRIRDRNAAVQAGTAAYRQGRYAQAATAYRTAVEQYGARDEAVVLNAAHALARAGQTAQARAYYQRLQLSRVPRTRSIARQQLAVLAARRGDYAQALGLLRKALLADPANDGARYNYEALKNYLTQSPDQPPLPPPADEAGGSSPAPADGGRQPRPKPGNDRTGQLNAPDPTDPTPNPSAGRPDQQGQADPTRPQAGAGSMPGQQFEPGAGSPQAVARGRQPGAVRGLSDAASGPEAPTGTRGRPGSEAAALDETQLQTQRERLQQMSLSPGQARQLLDALNAAEQQYLQQLPHRPTRKPEPGRPSW